MLSDHSQAAGQARLVVIINNTAADMACRIGSPNSVATTINPGTSTGVMRLFTQRNIRTRAIPNGGTPTIVGVAYKTTPEGIIVARTAECRSWPENRPQGWNKWPTR